MNSLRKHFPWMTDEEEKLLLAELMRRAAVGYEKAGQLRNAAECWTDLGRHAQAAELYVRNGDLQLAAPAYLAAGRYREALQLYQAWEESLPATDRANRLRAMLGRSACHRLGSEAGGFAPLSRTEGLSLFRRARAMLQERVEPLKAARSWTALAEYGRQLERFDLIHEGYEIALRHIALRHYEAAPVTAAAEKIETARHYLAVIRPYGDRLLGQAIEERLADWGAWGEEADVPAWHKLRDEIESRPFRAGGRDVLHFTEEAQWEAWLELARMEEAPAVDDYLRGLAPPDMIYIPPGPFLMGCSDDDPDADDREKPQHELWLPGYYIDRTPVTNARYRRFIEAGGYDRQEFWTEAGWQWKGNRNQPYYWNDDRFVSDDKPVVGVSWYEALAYARWAGKMLPSEAQWEKAAGWDPVTKKKRKYPWGDGWEESRCNNSQRIGRTTPVGQYSPAGDSPYGLVDMAGNVFEWCSSRWGTGWNRLYYLYPYEAGDGREDLSGGENMKRIVRGGSWYSSDDRMRCGFRSGFDPGFRGLYRGFRCLTPHAFFPPVLVSEFWASGS